MNAVTLSIIRYLLYFLLLGWRLRQFGIKTGTDLASTSFIPIAWGAGNPCGSGARFIFHQLAAQ